MGTDGTGTLAVLLRALREAAGLSQEELAERAGLSPHAISALERGTRTRPYPHTLRSLATAPVSYTHLRAHETMPKKTNILITRAITCTQL
ncbi:helix-turn-helix domain-containing protein [Nocardioides cavernae]|uniref:helix-turn-helix domain-containing protein n=1 Tax=Nocardioides cavernae TaxID=1921566 RepID=UPI00200BC4C1|nr:helix-turn-helix transcriptional regulator [Nocardioides cavernae]MCK9825981.1 helix-turn-helix domain-containing protein [Nocardioides cavernae]